MQRSMRLNALLAVAVAGLGAWVYFKPAADAPVTHPVSALRPGEVRALRIERGDAPAIVLQKGGDGWRLTAPFAARGNDFRIAQLLELLEAQAAHRLAATELARFELDRPTARVTVDGRVFAFGIVSPVTREQYVHAGDAVYPVSPRYGAVLPVSGAELVSTRLLGPGEAPARIEMKGWVVEEREGSWRRVPPAGKLPTDELAAWVDEWRHANAARVEPHAGASPAPAVRIGLKEGAPLAIAVLAREPELVLLRVDEKLKYHFRGETARRLLSPPSSE